VPFTIGSDGTGHTAFVVREGEVGSDGVRCGRGTRCGIVVQGATAPASSPVVPISFAAGIGAHYSAARVLIGLVVASALLALALLLIRRTDWRKPTEADTPDLDAAVLIDV
jgi:hypothetical protein